MYTAFYGLREKPFAQAVKRGVFDPSGGFADTTDARIGGEGHAQHGAKLVSLDRSHTMHDARPFKHHQLVRWRGLRNGLALWIFLMIVV